ncbi:hypothetical protein BDV18DRAFT_158725 [Aspergillus unguis]
MSTNNLPRITITPTPTTTQNPTTNPTWIFHDSTKPLPETGKLTQGLAEVSEKGIVFPAWGTILEPVHLKNVVVVVPNTKTSTESGSESPEKTTFKGLTLEGLVEVCGTSSDPSSSTDSSSGANTTAKPQVGDLAEGLWGDHATVLRYGKGKVVAVLEDVVVFLVKRPGGAIHPRMF